MKVYHIVCGRPIGPTWEAFLEKPELVVDEYNPYGTWVEEVEYSDLVKQFKEHVEYAAKHFPPSYGPYVLKVMQKYLK